MKSALSLAKNRFRRNTPMSLPPEAVAHSPVGASSMYRWVECPGSVKLSEGIESVESEHAKEGTRAHDIAAKVLETNDWPPNVDEETYEAVKTYVQVVKSDCHSQIPKENIFIEKGFHLKSIHEKAFGTSDAIVYDPTRKILRVYDYKHGKGIPVEVKGNLQMRYYALGALLETGFPAEIIELVVVQPRCFHADGPVRRERISIIDLLDFSADLEYYIKETEKDDASLKAGGHCRFCPASPICPELKKETQTLAKKSFSDNEIYDPADLAKTLESLPAIEGRIKAIREFAYNEIRRGRDIPGFKLVEKRATKRWTNEDQVTKELLHRIKLQSNDIYKTTLKSPAQMEKILGKRKDEIKEFIVSKSNGTTLVPDSDPRKPAKEKAKVVFDDNVDNLI